MKILRMLFYRGKLETPFCHQLWTTRLNRKQLHIAPWFATISMIILIFIKVNANSYCSLKLSSFFPHSFIWLVIEILILRVSC